MKYIVSKAPKKQPEYFLKFKKLVTEAGIECEVEEEGKELLLKVKEEDFERANAIKKEFKDEIAEEIGKGVKELIQGLKDAVTKE
jgi:hypothetical protein